MSCVALRNCLPSLCFRLLPMHVDEDASGLLRLLGELQERSVKCLLQSRTMSSHSDPHTLKPQQMLTRERQQLVQIPTHASELRARAGSPAFSLTKVAHVCSVWLWSWHLTSTELWECEASPRVLKGGVKWIYAQSEGRKTYSFLCLTLKLKCMGYKETHSTLHG